MNWKWLALAVLFVVTAGCNTQSGPDGTATAPAAEAPAAPAAPEAPAAAETAKEGAAEENPDLDGAIKLAMSYQELSDAMRGQGWSPVTDAQCLTNLVGRDAEKKCAQNPDRQDCSFCTDLPGLSDCSSDGYCAIVFQNPETSRKLEITMRGNIELWKINSPDTEFGVNGWRYLPVN